MKKKFVLYGVLLVIVAAAGCKSQQIRPAAQVDQTPVHMSSYIPFKKGLFVRDAVRKECDLGGKLATHINNYARQYHVNMMKGGKAKTSARVLKVEIINVHGSGGGAWSGAKSVAIEGKLLENGKVIGTFRGQRSSGGGAFGGFKGTCSILGRTVKALGSDVGLWLQHPVMGASIGEGG